MVNSKQEMRFEERDLMQNNTTTNSFGSNAKHFQTNTKGNYDAEDQLEFLTLVLKLQRMTRKWLEKRKRRLPLKNDKSRKLDKVVYFEDSDYYETISNKVRHKLSDIREITKPKLTYRKHVYDLSKAIYEG